MLLLPGGGSGCVSHENVPAPKEQRVTSHGTPGRPAPPPGPPAQNGARPARPRLVVLDGLRLVAALSVVVYHYTAGADRYWRNPGLHTFPTISAVTKYGWLGVELFFLISGFVICMSSWDRGLGDFLVSRVSRLYPAYWFAVLFTTAVMWLAPTPIRSAPKPYQVLANLTMMQTGIGSGDIDGPYWTLWRELLFYLLFAVVVWRGVNYRRTVVFCVIWLATIALTWTNGGFFGGVLDPRYSVYFIAGIAVYLMHRFRPTALLWGLVGVCWLLGLYGLPPQLPYLEIYLHTHVSWTVSAVIVTACFATIIAVGLGWLNRIQWRWLTPAGALTYPLYLIHATLGLTAIWYLSLLVPKYLLVAGLIVAVLGLAWLIHRFVERPVARRLRRGLLTGVADLRHATDPPVREQRTSIRTDLLKTDESPAQRATPADTAG
ncbi:MAG: Acyltransferase [Actinomycetia bacterium]|nr:Acyltransferase [Actinomycetes bacterium]